MLTNIRFKFVMAMHLWKNNLDDVGHILFVALQDCLLLRVTTKNALL